MQPCASVPPVPGDQAEQQGRELRRTAALRHAGSTVSFCRRAGQHRPMDYGRQSKHVAPADGQLVGYYPAWHARVACFGT